MRTKNIVLICFLIHLVIAVDQSKFRTCKDTDFCKRNRELVPGLSVYRVLPSTVQVSDDAVTADLINTYSNAQYALEVTAIPGRILRVQVDEKHPLNPRYHAKDVLLHTVVPTPFDSVQNFGEGIAVKFGNGRALLKIIYAPFHIELYVDDVLSVTVNERGLFNFDHLSSKPDHQTKGAEEQENSQDFVEQSSNNLQKPDNVPVEGLWSESFGGFNDNKQNGPESIGIDISFIGSKHVYGIPEHSTGVSLKNTKGDGISEDPYRLYNLDVFEYEIDKTMALYGAVPMMMSHDAEKTVGVFWLNPSEMFIDISDDPKGSMRKNTHWIAEAGVVDIFFMMGPSPYDVFAQYASLTGTGAMPQLFSVGYHQCRWNYRDEADVESVDSHFDAYNIPYDVIWLDIEHTDGKRYFTWDLGAFPNPAAMQEKIALKGRKTVVIIDPHIKRDNGYRIHSEAQSKGLYIKDANGNEYDGWCWPGSSSYLDFTEKTVRSWWADRFALNDYIGSTKHLYVWNDMNEPSVFNGPEVSMPKDAKHVGGWEHRALHNMYGYYVHMATYEGLIKRHSERNDRPFVLSRSFFAGSQRWGAVWTGDNAAQWSHLKASVPMLLSLGIGGINFVGADVGGFFNNPDAKLQARWYQLGAYYPFFRGHAHLDTKRREPWIFGEPYTTIIREAIYNRYTLLPYWYTLFHINNQTGAPLVRPVWVDFPKEEVLFDRDDSFLVGSELLVTPVVEENQETTNVYLPGPNTIWYDYVNFKAFRGSQTVAVDSPLDKIPVFVRGGVVIPKRERPRRSSTQMAHDPYTIFVALDKQGQASGVLYIDDGHSFNFQNGEYELINYKYSESVLYSAASHTGYLHGSLSSIERVVIIGANKPSKVVLHVGQQTSYLDFEYFGEAAKLVVRKPDVKINDVWNIQFL